MVKDKCKRAANFSGVEFIVAMERVLTVTDSTKAVVASARSKQMAKMIRADLTSNTVLAFTDLLDEYQELNNTIRDSALF